MLNIYNGYEVDKYLTDRFNTIFNRVYKGSEVDKTEEWDLLDSALYDSAEYISMLFNDKRISQGEASKRKEERKVLYIRDKTQRLLAADILKTKYKHI